VCARLFGELETGDPPFSRERWDGEMARQSWVAEAEGAVVGYLFGQPLEGVGYVRHVAVDPAARRRGVGRALLQAAAARFAEGGARAWCLNVKPDNAPAIALYESVGMRAVHRSWGLRLAWSCLDAWPASAEASPLHVARIEAESAGAWEEAFAIPSGLLSHALALARVVVGAQRVGERVGVASFDPSFPGCSPYCAADGEVARALLAAVRLHREPRYDGLKLFVERDAALVSSLVDRGATIALDALHLRGALPLENPLQ
jgi:GNAT superfamily N-acetyltransferase